MPARRRAVRGGRRAGGAVDRGRRRRSGPRVGQRRPHPPHGQRPDGLSARARWILRRRRRIDAIVDCQNGIPFFTPLVASRRTPIVCVIHHVHQAQFSLYLPRPAAVVARWIEGWVTRKVYRARPFAVVSPSTRTDARQVLMLRGAIHVLATASSRARGRTSSVPTRPDRLRRPPGRPQAPRLPARVAARDPQRDPDVQLDSSATVRPERRSRRSPPSSVSRTA